MSTFREINSQQGALGMSLFFVLTNIAIYFYQADFFLLIT